MKYLSFVLLLVPSCALAAPAQEFRVFQAAGLTSVYAATESGELRAEAAAGREVRVITEEADPGRCVITADAAGGRLTLKAQGLRIPQEKNWRNLFGLLKGFRTEDCHASFRVAGPASLALELKSASGDIYASGFAGAASIETASGEVSLSGLGGEVDVNSASGNISGSGCAKRLKAGSASGNVTLSGLCGPAAADTASGEIDLAWEKLPAAGDISVGTASGNVRLVLPASASISARLSSASGSVNNAFSSGTGGFPVKVDTASGNIEVVRGAK